MTDLAAHPATNVAVIVSSQVAAGLPAALRAAGRSVTTVGFAPTTGNLQDIEDGGLTAGLAIGQKDITCDPTRGWCGYADYAQRLTELWHPAG